MAAAAGALLFRHTIVVGRDEQLGVALKADDGELAQGDVEPAARVRGNERLAEAGKDAGGDVVPVVVAADVAVGVHELEVQGDGVHGLYYPHQIGKAIKVYPNHRAFSGLYAHFRPY